MAIQWLQASWKNVTKEGIQHFFQKCGFKAKGITDLENGIDEEFQNIFQQLLCSEDVSLEEFIGSHDNLVTYENETNIKLIDQRENSCKEAVGEVLSIEREASVDEESESEESDEEEDEI